MTEQNQTGQSPVGQQILHLLNSSIDGEISATEQDELDRLLIASPEIRNLNDELRTVTRLLDEVQELDPPEYLQDSIERQVRLPVQGHAGSKKPGLWGSGWLSANWLRTGFALAAGLVLTVGVYEMGSEPMSPKDSTSMVGTMANRGSTDQPGTLLDSIKLNTAELNGLVELHNKDDLFTLDLQLNSDEATEVVIHFADRGLEFDGVIGEQAHGDRVSLVNGAVHLASTGEQHYTVRLRRTSAAEKLTPLDVNFFASNDLILQAELATSKY
jgi:hypothetical protein